MGQLIEKEMKAGTLLATEGLPAERSRRARVRISLGGKLTVTDGPFTEAKGSDSAASPSSRQTRRQRPSK